MRRILAMKGNDMDKREFDIFMAKKRERLSANDMDKSKEPRMVTHDNGKTFSKFDDDVPKDGGDIIPHEVCLIRSCGMPIYVMAVDQGWAMVRRIGRLIPVIPEVFPVERLERVTSDGA